MENAEGILAHIKNIKYYSSEIRKLVSAQVDIDFDKDVIERISLLRRIWGEAADIDAHCLFIEANLSHANDKKKGESVKEEFLF